MCYCLGDFGVLHCGVEVVAEVESSGMAERAVSPVALLKVAKIWVIS